MTTLDQILAKSMALRGAGVLFVARVPINFQNGCGIGRRQFQDNVLLIHPADTDHTGTWTLPDLDVAGDAQIGAPVPFGDVLLARCDAEFKPSIDEDNYDTTWTCVDYAVACANDPQATTAIRKLLADSGASQSHGELKMDSSPRSAFIEAQSRATKLLAAFGDSAGADPFLQGEALLDYRARLVAQFKKYSKSFSGADLSRIQDPVTFAAIENSIYADAFQEATHPTTNSLKKGELRPHIRVDQSGRQITKYVASDDGALWDQFNPPVRLVKGGLNGFNTRGASR